MQLSTPETIRTLQRKLYAKAKQELGYRCFALYDKLWRADILMFAYRLVRANKGSPGIAGVSFEAIESAEGVEASTLELARSLKDRSYQTSAVRRVMIPKSDGSQRPLGIPSIRDRVAQIAMKLVIEPIFEADFCPTSYGFRPQIGHRSRPTTRWTRLPTRSIRATPKSLMLTCRNTSTASRIKSSWPSLPSALWMGESCISSNKLEVGQALHAYCPVGKIASEDQSAYDRADTSTAHADPAARGGEKHEREPSRRVRLLPLP